MRDHILVDASGEAGKEQNSVIPHNTFSLIGSLPQLELAERLQQGK